MNLRDAYNSIDCAVLRAKFEKFCSDIKDNLLPTHACPICGSDVRSSWTPSLHNEWLGACRICHLKIQITHQIKHDGHIIGGDKNNRLVCAMTMNLPVAMMKLHTCALLAASWKRMQMPNRALTPREDARWLSEVQRLAPSQNVILNDVPESMLRQITTDLQTGEGK